MCVCVRVCVYYTIGNYIIKVKEGITYHFELIRRERERERERERRRGGSEITWVEWTICQFLFLCFFFTSSFLFSPKLSIISTILCQAGYLFPNQPLFAFNLFSLLSSFYSSFFTSCLYLLLKSCFIYKAINSSLISLIDSLKVKYQVE